MAQDSLTSADVSQIIAGDNGRVTFDPTELQALAEDIRDNGLTNPPVYRRLPSGKLEIVAGERRTRAMRDILRWQCIPCFIRDYDDNRTLDVMLSENENRVNLSPMQQARAYDKRVKAGQTVEHIAQVAGKSKHFVESRVKLLELRPELQKLIDDGQLTVGYGQVIADFELDTNRQMLAVKTLQASEHPTIGLLKTVCSELKTQQAQDGFNFGIFTGDCPTLPIKQSVKEPPLPGKQTPARKSSFAQTLKSGYAFWTQAACDWRKLGRNQNGDKCQAAAQSLADVALAMFGLNFQKEV